MPATYCAVTDVTNLFPRFQHNLPNNIQDSDILGWIQDGKAVIRGRFLKRGYDPDLPQTLNFNPIITQLTTDQANLLRSFNRLYGAVKFGGAAYSSLSEGELKVVKRAQEDWDQQIGGVRTSTKDIPSQLDDGEFDVLFDQQALLKITEQSLGGDSGAGDFPLFFYSPTSLAETRMFWRGGAGNALSGTVGF